MGTVGLRWMQPTKGPVMAACLVFTALVVFTTLHPGDPPPTPGPNPPSTLAATLDRALYWPDRTISARALAEQLERACAAEEILACLLISGSVRDAPLGPIDALCADGEPDACTYALWRRAPRAPSIATRVRSERACRAGARRACVIWARAIARDAPKRARRIAARACADGEPTGCLLRATLEPEPIVRAAQLAAACADGDARGCQMLASLSGPNGAWPDAAQQALAWWRGCALGDQAACPDARRAWPLWSAR